MHITAFRRISKTLLLSSCGLMALAAAAGNAAWAADTVNLGSVQAEASGGNSAPVESAPYQAPSKTPLEATQPTSVVSQHYIQNNIPLSSNYDDVIKNTPSVWSVSPNGPGLMENQGLYIRGFQDGEYNVTFDGIPWGDSNDFTHHSTSYFMANDLGQASVDRGPGSAATIGDATFGGTVALKSKDPLNTLTLDPYGSYGSYNTSLAGGEVDSGVVSKTGGTKLFLDAEHLNSDGALSDTGLRRTNLFMKAQQPIGQNTLLTVVAMYNRVHQNVPNAGATYALGNTYGLNENPGSQGYYKYNYDKIRTDFEYIGTQTDFGDGWSLNNKLYTFGYYHHGFNGIDTSGNTANGTDPNGVVFANPNDVPGNFMKMDYRSYGDIARLQKTLSFGALKAGMWYDRQTNSRFEEGADMTTGQATSVDRLMHDSLDTFQPYAEVDWKALPKLTVQAGAKYAYFKRTLNALVNDHTGTPLYTSRAYMKVLPSFSLHYKIQPHWTAYAQAAEGFLAPLLQSYQANYLAGPGSMKPEQSWNYQVGSSYQSHRIAVSGDAYYINFMNFIDHYNSGPNKIYYNAGSMSFKGLEADVTYYLGYGLSAYANGGYNLAQVRSTGSTRANTPKETASIGLIYNKNGIYGSIINKYVGARWASADEQDGLDPYNETDLALGYTVPKSVTTFAPIKAKLKLNNLFNYTGAVQLVGATGNGQNGYWFNPGRSVFFSLSAPM
jgi:iron complex outermembrane receptor protein